MSVLPYTRYEPCRDGLLIYTTVEGQHEGMDWHVDIRGEIRGDLDGHPDIVRVEEDRGSGWVPLDGGWFYDRAVDQLDEAWWLIREQEERTALELRAEAIGDERRNA